jgi:hypothetical protein
MRGSRWNKSRVAARPETEPVKRWCKPHAEEGVRSFIEKRPANVNLAQWSAAAVAQGENLHQEDVGEIINLAQQGVITGPGGSFFGASGFIVNCPIVSSD